jgi:hypothetical protein
VIANKSLFGLLLWMLIASVNAMDAYVVDPKADVTKVTVPARFNNWICVNGAKKKLALVEDNKVLVPVGSRITMGVDVSINEYYGKSSCYPKTSFIPEAGKSYFMNLNIEAEQCSSLIYLISDKNRIGLEFEKSIDRGAYCQ